MTEMVGHEQGLQALREAVQASQAGQAARAKLTLDAPASTAGKIDHSAVAFKVFARLLEREGIRPALYSVLRTSNYRFISIFRFKNGRATSCVHVDRENLAVTQAGEVDDTATYCSFVRAQEAPFATGDAANDVRTEGHPARNVVLAYCGLPIMESNGTLIGTLCHYDVVPRDPAALDFDLLVKVVSVLSKPGVVPPYPDLDAARDASA